MTEEQSNQEYVVKMNGFFFLLNFQALFSIASAYLTLGGHLGMM